MIIPAANPLLGTFFHAIGGFCASIFYTPNRKANKWSWETYWLIQSGFAWLIVPIVGAFLTVPHFVQVVQDSPISAMRNAFILGAVYGIGGTTFGMALRYIGYSLTYSISIGLSCVLGTLLPEIYGGTLVALVSKLGGKYIMAGIAVGLVGTALCGYAGFMKERQLENSGVKSKDFNIWKGLPICIAAGFLSTVFYFSLIAGKPIASIAVINGAGAFKNNAVFPFAMGGAFISTAIYCLALGRRNQTLGEYAHIGKQFRQALPVNYVLAAIGGSLWYLQFFFYGMGEVKMGKTYEFANWAIHMLLLIFFSNLVGIMVKEWRGCETKTKAAIGTALLVMVGSVLLISYGNYLP